MLHYIVIVSYCESDPGPYGPTRTSAWDEDVTCDTRRGRDGEGGSEQRATKSKKSTRHTRSAVTAA